MLCGELSFEDAIRKSISIDGDTDTIAGMTGAIAESYYGVPEQLKAQVSVCLNENMESVLNEFYKRIP